mmetsp:Transcript_14287/g.1282  ORF Transcript_14287/g.1282 Transcript_14287/m.1282 type:complete len:85 (+) Transcript_14287:531-785(+)
MHKELKDNLKKEGLDTIATITNKYLEDVEYGEGYFDSIVLGNVLCEVPNIKSALDACYKLLKPGGRIYYIEHVIDSEGTTRRKV